MTGELTTTAMYFAACEDEDQARDEIWQPLHDRLIREFPTQRRSAVRMSMFAAEGAPSILDALQHADGDEAVKVEYAELRAKVAELGLLVIVMVDVAVTAEVQV